MATVTIDVYSDLACPWCYVGKRRMDNAIKKVAASGGLTFVVNWHAYMIDTSTPEDGMDYMQYNRKRWGGDGWTYELRESAESDGIQFANWKWWPNSLQAHRLIHYAKKFGKQSETKEALLVALYERGLNISLKQVVAQIGQELGFPDVQAYMESRDGYKEVREEDQRGKRELGISGVPYFIINGSHVLSGAQPTNAWVRLFTKLAK